MIARAQAARVLNVKGRTVSKWAERGLLVPVETKGTIVYFDRDAVEEFRRDHVFGPEAASILGVGELVVQKWARSGRLYPVSGPCVDGLHRYLFRLQDVEGLRPEHRVTAPEMAKQLGVSRRQIYTWIEKGRISPVSGPGVDGAKHYLFVLTQVEEARSQMPRYKM
jgi:excisionase family DNA binding protein